MKGLIIDAMTKRGVEQLKAANSIAEGLGHSHGIIMQPRKALQIINAAN